MIKELCWRDVLRAAVSVSIDQIESQARRG
jgi:hypothetical protein